LGVVVVVGWDSWEYPVLVFEVKNWYRELFREKSSLGVRNAVL